VVTLDGSRLRVGRTEWAPEGSAQA
jgi:hypothetical protein